MEHSQLAMVAVHDFWVYRIKFWLNEANGKISAAAEQEFMQSSGGSWVGVNRQTDYSIIFQTQIKKNATSKW